MAFSNGFANDVLKAIGNKSQRAIASKMECSPTAVGNMVMGRIPSDDILKKFAEAIGEDSEAWVKRADFYQTETYLRTKYKSLSDKDIEQIKNVIEKYMEE